MDKNLVYAPRPKGDVIFALEDAIAKLQDYKQQDDSTVVMSLRCIIHFVGDMHCPVHVKYADQKSYNVYLNGDKCSYHNVWDDQIISRSHRWGYLEYAHQLDRCTKQQIKTITAGTLRDWFHDTRFIAEDLGYLTPSVTQLVADSGFPGMKVLEFAFDSRDTSNYLPHTYTEHCICYTGTHDNSPLTLWRQEAKPEDIAYARDYLALTEQEGFHWGVIRGGMSSVAELFVAQMQDYLALGSEGRINVPGVAEGNWRWRMAPDAITPALAAEIRTLTETYGR